MPTPSALFALILFGVIGSAAFLYGKKNGKVVPMVVGGVLVVYPYFVSATWLLYGLGFVLTGALFVLRE
ncbi:MAG: hypothetical protein KDD11_02240 [Acidobacteria bacterium]|nr:hypothetical protein [Acidobacteriota bacterium]